MSRDEYSGRAFGYVVRPAIRPDPAPGSRLPYAVRLLPWGALLCAVAFLAVAVAAPIVLVSR